MEAEVAPITSVFAILAVSLSLAVGRETPPKISLELLEKARTNNVLPVPILLTDQPQREILERGTRLSGVSRMRRPPG